MRKQLILLGLNELNFDLIERYVQENPKKFMGLENLLKGKSVITSAEKTIDELNPWIQWTSIFTGRTYDEHKVFRLGDITKSKIPQLFEELENEGIKVGAISPMNAENRLKRPSYFIPDPWTNTNADGAPWLKRLSKAVTQAVNDNAKSKITWRSIAALLFGFFRCAKLNHYPTYLKLFFTCKGAPWRKALFLDLLLHDLHVALFKKYSPNFSMLFLNAAAHIQHHYIYNSKFMKEKHKNINPDWYIKNLQDPFYEMMEIYEIIVSETFENGKTEAIIATGLSQKPYKKIEYYYRLKSHGSFLDKLGIKYSQVLPRMSRCFLIEFDSNEDKEKCEKLLNSLLISENNLPLFGEIENRDKSLYVTLTYPNEITNETTIAFYNKKIPIKNDVAFVAIKNAEHRETGFSYYTSKVSKYAPKENSHVKNIYFTIREFFTATST